MNGINFYVIFIIYACRKISLQVQFTLSKNDDDDPSSIELMKNYCEALDLDEYVTFADYVSIENDKNTCQP